MSAALKRARRRDIPGRATAILAALRAGHLGQPEALTTAYAATVQSLIAVITVLDIRYGKPGRASSRRQQQWPCWPLPAPHLLLPANRASLGL